MACLILFRSQYTTGRGSSGVGLTAAVVKVGTPTNVPETNAPCDKPTRDKHTRDKGPRQQTVPATNGPGDKWSQTTNGPGNKPTLRQSFNKTYPDLMFLFFYLHNPS